MYFVLGIMSGEVLEQVCLRVWLGDKSRDRWIGFGV